MDPVASPQLRLALALEALRRSTVLWLALPSAPTPRLAWYAWLDAAAYLVHEGDEQQLPGLDDLPTVEISLRSKDKGSLLVRIRATVEPLEVGGADWVAAAAELHARRQSPPDGEGQPARWAAQSRITRLRPVSAAEGA